jgi:hypothetical protein
MFVLRIIIFALLLELCSTAYSPWTISWVLNSTECRVNSSAYRFHHNFTGEVGLQGYPKFIAMDYGEEEWTSGAVDWRYMSDNLWDIEQYDETELPYWYQNTSGISLKIDPSCCANGCTNLSTDLDMNCDISQQFKARPRARETVTRDYILSTVYWACALVKDAGQPEIHPFDFENTYLGKRSSNSREKRITKADVRYKDNTVYVYPSTQGTFDVTASANTLVSKECNTSCALTLPSNWIHNKIAVFVYSEGQMIYRGEFEYSVPTTCHVANCFLCTENFNSFSCLSGATKAFIICSIVFGAVTMIVLFAMLFVMIRTINKLPPKNALVLCILLCAPMVSACDSNIIVSGQQVDCVVSGMTEECTLKTQSLITLPTLGSTICLTVLNEESNLVMGFVNITYMQSWAVAGLQLDYWTSNREVVSSSSKHCPGHEFCSSTNNCVTTRSNRATMDGAIQGAATLFPGVSICNDGCGCWACNCGLCHEACVYQRYAIQPVPSLWQIMRLATSRLVPRIETCYSTAEGHINCTSAPFLSGSSRTIGGNFSLTYIGSFQTSFNFLDQKILIDESRSVAFFVQASERNLPMAGQFGEIQGNSAKSFTNATPGSFIMDPTICSPYISDSIGYYDCVANPFLSLQSNSYQLPHTIDGVFWEYSQDNTLVGNVLNPPGLSLSMIGTGSLKFKTTRVQVCPYMEFKELKGVWGDQEGAQVIISAYSTCLPGKCVLSTYSTKIELDSVFLTLSPEAEDHVVLFRSNAKDVNFELSCNSLGQTYTIEVKGELDDPTPISPVLPPSPPEGFNHWFSDLSLAGKIGFGIGVGLGGLLLLALLLILLWYVPDMIMWCHNYRTMDKSDTNTFELSEQETSLTDTTTDSSTINPDDPTGIQRIYERARLKFRGGM